MPPVHPAIVHYPIALVTLSVIADFFGYLTDSASLHAAGWWALLGAAIGASLAVAAGLFDMSREKIEHTVHERVHKHMKIGFTVLAAVAGLTVWRWLILNDPRYGLGWGYLIVAVIVLGLTFFQGWLGGQLVYSDGVGVAPTGQGPERADKAKARTANLTGRSKVRGDKHHAQKKDQTAKPANRSGH